MIPIHCPGVRELAKLWVKGRVELWSMRRDRFR